MMMIIDDDTDDYNGGDGDIYDRVDDDDGKGRV